jgi:hypothetical protein
VKKPSGWNDTGSKTHWTKYLKHGVRYKCKECGGEEGAGAMPSYERCGISAHKETCSLWRSRREMSAKEET